MSYKGKYHPTKREKYRGDVNNIIYRSLWERSFMKYCDDNPDVVEWGSEEIVVPYISPIDGKRHRYFPDFYVKTSKGDKFLVEIKPKSPDQNLGQASDIGVTFAPPPVETIPGELPPPPIALPPGPPEESPV